MTILEQIAAHARKRVASEKKRISTEELRSLAVSGTPADGRAFCDALAKPGLRFICEVKKASPSKAVEMPVRRFLKLQD